VRAIADARIKTDTIDSETLAHLLRADLIPEAYACSSETRAENLPREANEAREQVPQVGLRRGG